jgi:mono/diheme cytochrome c family protein
VKSLVQLLRTAARVGFVIVAWTLVALVCVQVFHAGYAVLVNPGDWQPHTNLGHMFALPIMLLLALSLIGWMPYRFALLSIVLFVLYTLQYFLLYLPPQMGTPALTALHPVNALAIFATAGYAARNAWRLVTEKWAPARKAALTAGAVAGALLVATQALGSGAWEQGGAQRSKATTPSLAEATEVSIPESFRSLQPPAAADANTVAAGRQIAEQRCIACHATDFKGKQVGAIRSADLTQSAAKRSDQFLLWAISTGSQRGMPAWGEQIPEEQRWQLVAFIKSLKAQ